MCGGPSLSGPAHRLLPGVLPDMREILHAYYSRKAGRSALAHHGLQRDGAVTTSEKAAGEGILIMQPSGRWAIAWPDQPDREPQEITSGDVLRVEVAGRQGLHATRMEFAHREKGGGGAYYSVDGYLLWEGMRAAPGGGE